MPVLVWLLIRGALAPNTTQYDTQELAEFLDLYGVDPFDLNDNELQNEEFGLHRTEEPGREERTASTSLGLNQMGLSQAGTDSDSRQSEEYMAHPLPYIPDDCTLTQLRPNDYCADQTTRGGPEEPTSSRMGHPLPYIPYDCTLTQLRPNDYCADQTTRGVPCEPEELDREERTTPHQGSTQAGTDSDSGRSSKRKPNRKRARSTIKDPTGVQITEDSPLRFHCTKCDSWFRSESRHSSTCDGIQIVDKRKECEICKKSLRIKNYNEHKAHCTQELYLNPPEFKCEKCTRTFARQAAKTHHLAKCDGIEVVSGMIKCPTCEMTLMYKSYGRHKKTHE